MPFVNVEKDLMQTAGVVSTDVNIKWRNALLKFNELYAESLD